MVEHSNETDEFPPRLKWAERLRATRNFGGAEKEETAQQEENLVSKYMTNLDYHRQNRGKKNHA